MARILVIDADAGMVATLSRLLRSSGHDVATAANGAEGLRLATRFDPDVTFVGPMLRDMTGVQDVIATLDLALQASRHLRERQTADEQASRPFEPGEPHALTRWADVVIRLLTSPRDTPNLQLFAHAVGVSVGAFRNWCRTAGLPARRSLYFARGLRAVARGQGTAVPPERLLNVVDRRTLDKFLLACGSTDDRLPASVEIFLERQSFIDNAAAVAVVRTLTADEQESTHRAAADAPVGASDVGRDTRGNDHTGVSRREPRYGSFHSEPGGIDRGTPRARLVGSNTR